MSLLSIDYVKDNFPLWVKYFLDDESNSSEIVLQKEMDQADIKLSEFLSVTAETIADPLKLHLMNIIRKRGFDRMLGDMVFESKPQIIRDYEETIKLLTDYKNGKAVPEGTDLSSNNQAIKITAKPRRFKDWFNNDLNDITSLNQNI